ncbi:cation-translocating P-type ATPase [Candidatus Saccharibacteria bacterium CPR2]|nr:cation-translocating P-type ATPase [Candidatus Saccharibacteria bacterium CPR2]
MEYYKQSIDDIQNQFGVKYESGLSQADVAQRQKKFGKNELKTAKKISPLKLFLSQFNDVLIFVLIAAATVSLGISYLEKHNNYTESILIYCIVIAIALVGFFNEYKAEKTVEALKKLVGHKAKVRRGGSIVEIDAIDIVPGDVILLEEGTKIPADIRLYLVKSMSVNESSLTGESVPVSKNTLSISETVALGDQKNMAFSGTLVTTGVAEGIVVASAHDTQIGKIATMVNEVEEDQTPMQKKLDELGRKLGAIILAICVAVFVIIYFLDKDLQDEGVLQRVILAFTAAVALAVAAIPEGLAFVVRISLALGARRMAAKNALVRKLSAVEALGSTDVICSDKTGTLTRGEMTVRQIWASQKTYEVTGSGYETAGNFLLNDKPLTDVKNLDTLLRVGMLCNNARLKDKSVMGDPTEGCLIVSAMKADLNFEEEIKKCQRIDEIPFSSERKRMSTIHRNENEFLVASKGAADVLLNHCDRIFIDGKIEKLTKELKDEVLEINSKMASSALRVLAMAYKEERTQPKGENEVESNLIFLGLQGMMDPPRLEVKEVMQRVTNEAGMKVVMITGDHIETARAVAKEIGIVGEAISGVEIDQLSEEEFEKKVLSTSVYARVNPEHKIRIVKALQKHKLQVAMTGDGVNDAPAIKAADIGVAMGITGTDVTKEAADLILLDDQFLTIISAIEEGRGIFDNVRKFVNYLLSANIAEVLTVLGGVVFFSKLVLSAAQLLFINIVTDGLPAIALGSDPAEKGIMRFKPNHFQGSIINFRIWLEMFIFGMVMTVALLVHYWYIVSEPGHDGARATAVIFVAMVIYELIRLIGIRSEYKISWFANPWLLVAIFTSLILQILVLYIPSIAKIFKVAPIHTIDWIFIAIGSLGLLVFMKILDIILDRTYAEVQAPKITA